MVFCVNCGAELGLHHYETNQCPTGGMEASVDREQTWENTIFESDARIVALEDKVKTLQEIVLILSKSVLCANCIDHINCEQTPPDCARGEMPPATAEEEIERVSKGIAVGELNLAGQRIKGSKAAGCSSKSA